MLPSLGGSQAAILLLNCTLQGQKNYHLLSSLVQVNPLLQCYISTACYGGKSKMIHVLDNMVSTLSHHILHI